MFCVLRRNSEPAALAEEKDVETGSFIAKETVEKVFYKKEGS